MKDTWKECVGCYSFEFYDNIKYICIEGIPESQVKKCPCQVCLIKSMCTNTCQEYKKIIVMGK
jgi:hypothetical protein